MQHADASTDISSHLRTEIIGHTEAICALRSQIERLVAFDSVGNPHAPTLLLYGETGTGKGLVARVIHACGPRARGLFVHVNCAAIPDALIEGELFGFEAGAFTDAKRSKPGLFEAAAGGSLFLDEIDALPLLLQGKLLNAIEDKRVRRLGSTTDRQVDVKLIAATKEDLSAGVEAGRFRADLYHRLAVVILTLPPLRDRGDDILQLAKHFLQKYAQAHGALPKRLSPDAEAWLRRYRWPGNVRELSHVIERITLLSSDDVLQASTLEQWGPPQPAVTLLAEPTSQPSAPQPDEADRIRQALIQAGGNVSQAARRLGLTRNTLRYRMRRHRIQRPGLDEVDTSARPPLPRPSASPPNVIDAASHVPISPWASAWEQKPVAVIAIDVTFPQDPNQPFTTYESWTVEAQWERLVTDKIQGFGGLCMRHTPSLLIALFGVPQALEQMPQRAIHAAFAIQHLASSQLFPSPSGLRPVIRLAVHHGTVLVAVQQPTSPPMAQGETIALPTRLLGHTNPGEVLVSPQIGRQITGLVDLQPRKVQLGTEAADWVEVYSAARLKRQSPTLGHQHESMFVGRERELTILQEQLNQTEAGQGQVVGIVGEPGVGKSRLIAEFRRSCLAGPHIVLEGRSPSYGHSVPYLPVLDLLRQSFNLVPTDDLEVTAAKLDAALERLGVEPADVAPYLRRLLGLPTEAAPLAQLSSEAIKNRTFSALRQMLLAPSQHHTLVIVVEDLQWIDQTSEAFFTSLVQSLHGGAVLFLNTYRPGYRPPWIERSYVTQISLRPLSSYESECLVSALLEPEPYPLPDPVVRIILDKAEGNPFFLEELVHAVVKDESPQPDVKVPDTIQGVLMARIDRLAPAHKKLLQIASILGREVSLDLLRMVWHGSEELDALLPELQRLEFLHEHIGSAEPRYLFRHALTQEVVYESLPLTSRQDLHAAAGQALETLYAHRLELVYNRLAYHYARSEEHSKAIEYLSRVREQAARCHSHIEAIAALQASMPHIQTLASEARDRTLVEMVLHQAFSLSILGRFGDILDLLLPYQSVVEALHDPALAGPYHFRLALNYSYLNHPDQVVHHARKAIDEAQQCGDRSTLGKAHYALSLKAYWSSELLAGLEHGQQAVALLQEVGDQPEWVALPEFVLGLIHAALGHFEPALEAEAHVLAIAHDLDEPRLQSFASYTIGWLYAIQGDGDNGLDICQRAVECAPDPLSKALSMASMGHVYLLRNEPDRAIPVLEQAIEQFDRMRLRQTQGPVLITLGEAQYAAGELDQAEHTVAQGQEICREAHKPHGEGHAQRVLGQIALSRDRLVEAERHLQHALRLFTGMHARYDIARVYLLLAEWGHRQNRPDISTPCLIEAYHLFRQMHIADYAAQAETLATQLGISLPGSVRAR